MIRIKKIFSGLILMMIAVAVTAQQPQEPDAVYHQLVKEYTIHEDGSFDLHYYKELELVTPFAFNRLYGESFIVYNPDYQDLKINKAYTIMADGERNPSPENAFNEVLPRQASDFPAFSHLREMVVTHTGLEEGATIYLDYTLSTKAGMFPGFSFYEELRKRVPVEEMKVIVHTPEDYRLEHKVRNLRTGPEVKDTKKGKTYTWVFKSLPAKIHEGDLCEDRVQTLAIQGSEGVQTQLDLESFSYSLPAELSKMINTQKEKKEGALNDLMYLFNLLQETVDKSHLPQQFAGSSPRTPLDVWKSNVGNTLERTILLAAMVREAGTYAVPVLVVKNAGLPVLHTNNQLMVHVQIKDGASMLLSVEDAKIENHMFTLSNMQYFPLEKGKTNQRTTVPEAKNEYAFNASLTLTPDTLYGNGQIDLQHAMNPFFLLQDDNNSLTNLVKGMPAYDASLSLLSPASSKGKLYFAAHNTDVLKAQLGPQIFTLPVIKGGVSDWNMTLYDDRISPIEIPFPVSGSTEITVNLENMECLNNNFELTEEFSFGNVSVYLEVEDSKVVVKKKISLNKKCYNPLEYSELRDALRVFQKEEINKLVFRLQE